MTPEETRSLEERARALRCHGTCDDTEHRMTDALIETLDAEREKVARLERERDELAAQLAALREAATGAARFWTDAPAPISHDGMNAVVQALFDALSASAPAVEAYTRRVQAEALESAADEIEARGEATRHPWMLGPSEHNPSGTVLTDAGAAKCDEARWLRARARELRGGR